MLAELQANFLAVPTIQEHSTYDSKKSVPTALPAEAAMLDTCINLEGAQSEGDNNDFKTNKKVK
jgi:hypothetical protein